MEINRHTNQHVHQVWSRQDQNSDLESGNPNFGQFKGHNSGVPRGIWQVIEHGRDIMPTNIFTKFDKDLMKTP